ncbi:MAG TPA: YbdD/YjiX family protein [Gemmatimonadaceae bacterium]|nr:YbdD/YjiX family protein [Gemmatimonadaceae bacterium]
MKIPLRRAMAPIRSITRFADVVRRVIGVPDYDVYLSHLRSRHPDQHPLSRDEFTRQRLNDRYNKPGSRCC